MSPLPAKAQVSATATTNACKLCTPLGACLVFRGIEGAIPLLHGSQGCSTYIRRYVISHFREPIDIASSNFSESTAIFGGGSNLATALKNVTNQYHPTVIGVASTCLSETIGDDVTGYIKKYQSENKGNQPLIIQVSTPSYRGTHIDGFHDAVKAVVQTLANGGVTKNQINVLPGFVSAADLRYLKEIMADFSEKFVLLPDYSDSLDGPSWSEIQKIPEGGTELGAIRSMGRSVATVEFGATLNPVNMTGKMLEKKFGVTAHQLNHPIGVEATDRFMALLASFTGRPIPEKHLQERGRLIDAYVDGHKYLFEKKAIVYGEEDLVVALTGFLAEIGITPVLCASGGESGRLAETIYQTAPQLVGKTTVHEGVDFEEITAEAKASQPDLLIGNSKGYSIAHKLNIPLLRVGFPIHDRIGGQRILHLGYRGAQQLFDAIVNCILEQKQGDSHVGYGYM